MNQKLEEWKSKASEDALEQYNKDIDWFKYSVKCCHNCEHWDMSQDMPFDDLMFEYRYNFCTKHNRNVTVFDAYCDDYEGVATEQNLIDYLHIDWEEEQ